MFLKTLNDSDIKNQSLSITNSHERTSKMQPRQSRLSMISNLGYFKKTSEFGLKSIPNSIQNNIKLNFFKYVTEKTLYNPKKLKIKEFENFLSEKIEYINSFIRRTSYEMKRIFYSSEWSGTKLFEKLQESLFSASLASSFLFLY